MAHIVVFITFLPLINDSLILLFFYYYYFKVIADFETINFFYYII